MRQANQTSDNDQRGLTLAEVLIVLALMSILALGALPLVHNQYRAKKELELKRTLFAMREAIDRYHDYAKRGMIEPWDLDWNMYPESLDSLIEGVEVRFKPEEEPKLVRFLRQTPVDPMTGEQSWDCRGYEDEPDERSQSCDDLYDVFSQSRDEALDGTYYSDW